MALSDALFRLGQIVFVGGLVIEVVAFIAMAFEPIRRGLGLRSPLHLQAIGCMLFFTGVTVIVLARVLV
jgi:hypothetical protein